VTKQPRSLEVPKSLKGKEIQPHHRGEGQEAEKGEEVPGQKKGVGELTGLPAPEKRANGRGARTVTEKEEGVLHRRQGGQKAAKKRSGTQNGRRNQPTPRLIGEVAAIGVRVNPTIPHLAVRAGAGKGNCQEVHIQGGHLQRTRDK